MQYPGAVYHVFDRGDRKEPIFLSDDDRLLFLDTLAETCERTGFVAHCYALMKNHYHLEIETPEPNLVEGMRWFQGTYTQRFNRRHDLVGHLYQGRYQAKPIQMDEAGHFLRVADYIHLNPARSRLLDSLEPDLRNYPWTSFSYFIHRSRHLSAWLTPRRVFACLGLEDDAAGRRRFREYLNRRVREVMGLSDQSNLQGDWKMLRQGWYVGNEIFRDWLLEKVEAVVTPRKRESYYGPELRRHDEKAAERLMNSALQAIEMTLSQLRELKQNDARKQGVAWLVKSRSVVGDIWIVELLRMGHRSNVSRAVRAYLNPPDKMRKHLKSILHKCTD